MKICVLASGSRGNSTLIATSHTRLLVDVGLSGKETARRLSQLGIVPDELDAILIGHEHSDHVQGLPVLAGRHGIPVYINRDTARAAEKKLLRARTVKIFTNGQSWEIGDLTILPFSVFHDAQDPVGFVVRQGEISVLVATDLGMPTRLVKERLKGNRVIVLEANHDPDMLINGSRPWRLKQRIKSRQGHLSNETAARLLAEDTSDSLTDIFLAHLSQDCNHPEKALKVIREHLEKKGRGHIRVRLTYQDRISEVVELNEEPQMASDRVEEQLVLNI
ncbi:MAG: MBL fold metallo-hydrolase [Candidatus Auribacterota bacterium]|nr:MBL fold metallo-hydrolase [Candidatus Auribacterota bacterium]